MDTSASLLGLVVATFVRRPYVFAFLGVSALGESTLVALGVVLHLSVGFILWCWYAVRCARADVVEFAPYPGSRAGAK